MPNRLRKAASKDHAAAQYQLSLCWRRGLAVDKVSLLRRFRALLPRDRALLWVLITSCLSIGAGVSRCGYDVSFAEIQGSFAER